MPRTFQIYEVTLFDEKRKAYDLPNSDRTKQRAVRRARQYLDDLPTKSYSPAWANTPGGRRPGAAALLLHSKARDTDHGVASEYVGFEVLSNAEASPALVKYVHEIGRKTIQRGRR